MRPRIIDRYVIREIIPPFLLALLVFTFILIIPFIIDLAEKMIAKGVPGLTILEAALTLVPQALALTIPMALLIALLVGLGRISADREFVVMMACGISPYRLLRPILFFAVICWGATSWVMLKAMPDGNQRYRTILTEIAMNRAEGEVRPRVFFQDFPNVVVYVREVPKNGQGWLDVLAADTSNPSAPVIYLAKRGHMVIDRQARTIQMVLEDGTRHSTKLEDPAAYEFAKFGQTILTLNPESVFPRTGPARGNNEMTIKELKARIAELKSQNLSPHNEIMTIQKKFSFPVACLVFSLIGLALGANNRRDGKLAAFVIGIGVIFVYYGIMATAEALTKGFWIPAWLADWLPNIFLGIAGVVLLISRARSADQPIRIPIPAWITRRRNRSAEAPAAMEPSKHGGTKGRAVVVVRIPHFEIPRPSLLDIYIARQYLRILAMTTVGMLGLFYVATFFDLSDKLFKGQAGLGLIGEYLFWQTPQYLSYVLALAVLLSALVTVGLLTKNSELIVMRACGISLYRTALPMVAFALLASAILFGLEEQLLAPANQRAEQLNHLIRTGAPLASGVVNRQWVVGIDGEVYHYQYFDPRNRQLNGLSVFQFDPKTHNLRTRIFVQRATYMPQPTAAGVVMAEWLLDQGWQRDFDPKTTTKTSTYVPIKNATARFEPAEYFATEKREPEMMNFTQLRAYIKDLENSGYNVLEQRVWLQRKIAFPFVTLVMTLIAVPFAVTTGRRGAMYGIGVGIVLALVYWTMISVFAAIGQGGLISPVLAAWAPNIIFGAAAAYLLLTVRT